MHFKLTPKQTEFVGAYEQFPAYIAGIGTGKSTALIAKALFHSWESPNNLGIIVRKNYTDLRDSTIKDYETYTGRKINESKKEDVLPNGSVILFRHGDELPVLKNINAGFFGIEQCDEFEDDTAWQFLKMRLRRQIKFRSGFIVGNTAGHNWVWKIFKENGAPPNHRLVEASTIEHADYLPKDYIDNLKTLPIQLFKQYVENSWEILSGRIFQMWDEKFHVISDQTFPDWWETFGAMDTAVASGVFSAGLYKVDPQGNIIRFKEYYDKEKLISEHCRAILEMSKGHNIVQWIADPSAFNKTREKMGQLYSVADELQDYGISIRPGENNVDAGINRMGEYLNVNRDINHPYTKDVSGSPRLFITESCAMASKEIAEYKEVPNKLSDRGDRKWEPYKHNDHSVDEVRYTLMSRPSIAQKAEEVPARKRHTVWAIEHEKELRDVA